jgi:glyoxylase-like metal-dependent hydrolase (beta-lactamase superfamily II)
MRTRLVELRNTVTTLIGVALVGSVGGAAQSPAPLVKTQAPGFYRMMLGSFEITALNDGVVAYPTSTLTGATAEQIRIGQAEAGLGDPVEMSYNAFLVNTGTKLVLIDTGTGGKLDESPGFHGAGRLLANLRAAGYRPEQVDDICITHVGPDHVGGLTIGTERTFPNAVVHAARAEIEVYVDSAKSAAVIAAAPNREQARGWIEFQSGLFAPYVKAGKVSLIDRDGMIVPGVRALATHGHTPGHTSYIIDAGGGGPTMVVLGDLIHWASVQFHYPSASSAFDADPNAAAAERLRVIRLAADSTYWIAGAHLSFPGLGHVRAGDGRFYWIPTIYTIPR